MQASRCSPAALVLGVLAGGALLMGQSFTPGSQVREPQPARPAGAPLVILQIRVLEGEGEVHGAGTRSRRPLTVQLTSETGRPVAGASVSFQLPADGPSGEFAAGGRVAIETTGPDGRASVSGIRWNSVAGPLQIRITAAKDNVRAGTVVAQYIAERAAGARGRGKWIFLGVAAAGAAAGGLAAALSNGSGSPAAPPRTPPRIGAPAVTVGRP
ncbi:MAG: hypothetical protein HYZ57_10180 [Acidobacteria bacterium]|nr:hypothetical protein [Acidobacteriota bacterium]